MELTAAKEGAGRYRPAPSSHLPPAIRVAFCIDNMRVGGTELNAVRTAERLDRAHFAVTLFCLDAEGPLLARYGAAGIEVVAMPIASLYGSSALRQGLRLRRELRRRRIDVVHAHDLYSNVFVAPWAWLAGVPVVITSRRWWTDLLSRAHAIANRAAYAASHAVLANSPAVGRMLTHDDGVPARRVIVVPNFVDDDAFEAPAPGVRAAFLAGIGVPADATVLGIVANLSPIKNHAMLVRAVATLAERWSLLHLVCIGEGQCRGELEQLARTLGIADRVHLAGFRSNRPNPHFCFDLSALASTSEGFPNSLVEAMAAGRPVVATSVGGVPDAVTDGETGLLVPPDDAPAFAAAIETLLRDPALGLRMGAAGRVRARERYDGAVVVPALEQAYRTLLSVAGGPR